MPIGSSPARGIAKNEKVAYTDSAAASAAAPNAREVLLISTTDCYIKFDGTATADGDGNQFLIANVPLQFTVPKPTSTVSAIRSTTSGILFVTWLW